MYEGFFTAVWALAASETAACGGLPLPRCLGTEAPEVESRDAVKPCSMVGAASLSGSTIHRSETPKTFAAFFYGAD